MSDLTVGIVDYGMGNHASVMHSLRELGFRVRVSAETGVLNDTDILLLPGVGAFPAAMQALHRLNLVTYLQEQAKTNRPMLGICLGMQLLAQASHEYGYTVGLDLIPGEIIAFADRGWHIGWNTLECTQQDTMLQPSDGQAFYFNHSYHYQGPAECQLATAHRDASAIPAVIRRGNVVGVQFHPEKSQGAGKILLSNLITGLAYA